MKDLEELDPDFIMAKQVEQLEKEKKELQERLKNQEKKVEEFLGFCCQLGHFSHHYFVLDRLLREGEARGGDPSDHKGL